MYDWSKTAVLCHNAQFDASILSFIYDCRPCFIFDSLSMGRALRGVEVGNSLAKLAAEFGLPPKGEALHSTDGVAELTWEVESELATYCKHDVFLCEEIFKRLVVGYPIKELRLIDMTVRMYTEPELVLDGDMLVEALAEEKEKLASALVKADTDESTLASNDHFAEVLRNMGIEPPTKISRTTGKEAYAFAKNDALFQQLLNSDDEDVALLCEARLRVKSTSVRTRAQRFIDISTRGRLPVPLSYYGAATGRWSAAKGGSINLQNLKRGSVLRKAICAPAGKVICAGDLSQIEPRVLSWLADYEEMLEIFRAGGDPYATFGVQMFNVPGLSKEEHPLLRQSAKSALLGAGYQLGWVSFAGQLLVGFLGAPPVMYNKADAKQLGVTMADIQKFISWEDNLTRMAEIPHTCSEEELLIHCLASKAIIDKYRAAAVPVVGFWDFLGTMLTECLYGGKEYEHKGVLKFRKGEIEMVNGMCLRYPDLQMELDKKGRPQYTFADGKKRKKIYAGLICNNVTQGLARIIMSDGLLRVQSQFPVKGTVHDEGLFLLNEDTAEEEAAWVKAKMIQVPKWMPNLPLNADVGFDKRYGLAKA
jgi:DNA polymerase